MTTLGVLHPGDMGASLAACAKANSARVLWAGAGRSEATRARATAEGLEDAGDLAALCAQSDIILSIVPPHAAEEQARAVAACGFAGLYVDANAISPDTARRVASIVEGAGADFVDGGVVGPPARPEPLRRGEGPPAREAAKTRLYLSGARAHEIAALFADTFAEPVILDGGAGAASALKMVYAGWTKGRSALLLAMRALARAEGVDDALMAEWARSLPGLEADSEAAAARVAPKAWRWVGEMQEIADSLKANGLPDGSHRAAAQLYAALEGFKTGPHGEKAKADFESVMRAILDAAGAGPTSDGKGSPR